MSDGVGLLDDQIEEAQAAFVAAHEAKDTEGAQALADHLRALQSQKAAVDKAALESSQSQASYKNPMITAGVGATLGALAGPIRNEISGLVSKPAPIPEMSVPHPTSITQSSAAPGGQNWTKALTGVDVPGAQMEKESLDVAKRMAGTVARGGEFAGGTITPGGVILPPQIGVKAPAPAPMIPRNIAQAKEKGMNLLQSVVGEHQPSRPFDIVKGGAKGAFAGAALGDLPQQLAQGNIGTAATDVGLGAGTILHGLAKTPKLKALAGLLGLGSGAARTIEGVNELTTPMEQKAGGGLIGNIASQAAYNAPYIAPQMASIGKNVGRGAYAPAMEDVASLGLALAPLTRLTGAMSLMTPGEAGRGSTVDEWNVRKAAEQAARIKAQKQLEYQQFMQQQVGANAPQLFEDYLVQQAIKKAQGGLVHLAEGGLATPAAPNVSNSAGAAIPGSLPQNVADYYNSFTDTPTIVGGRQVEPQADPNVVSYLQQNSNNTPANYTVPAAPNNISTEGPVMFFDGSPRQFDLSNAGDATMYKYLQANPNKTPADYFASQQTAPTLSSGLPVSNLATPAAPNNIPVAPRPNPVPVAPNNIPVAPRPNPVPVAPNNIPVAPRPNPVPVAPRPNPVPVAPANINQPVVVKTPFINRGMRPSVLNPFNFRRR